jgi:hypothetical protein
MTETESPRIAIQLPSTAIAQLPQLPYTTEFFVEGFFPAGPGVPFGNLLDSLFFSPIEDNKDFPIHGPNVVRLAPRLLDPFQQSDCGLFAGTQQERDATVRWYQQFSRDILTCLEVGASDPTELSRMQGFLRVAALYHDIGKNIRRANHPAIGANLLRSFDPQQSKLLVAALRYQTEGPESDKHHNRFSLITSVTQHHDKFGVVSTGEGSLPLFSDILYFTSDANALQGICKNVTTVMLLNLADIAAVSTAPPSVQEESLSLVKQVAEIRGGEGTEEDKRERERQPLHRLIEICSDVHNCLGLRPRKARDVLEDWKILVDSIVAAEVQGNRGRLKRRLFDLERNPARAITRIRRLLVESAETSGASALKAHFTPTVVESVLVGTLGSHHFQTFCEQLATIVKLDYGLNLFKALTTAKVRNELQLPAAAGLDWKSLSREEADHLAREEAGVQDIAIQVTVLFVKVLAGLVSRYGGVLGQPQGDPRRWGFQLRDLTGDARVRQKLIELLCGKYSRDHIALTWIADEVFIWSLD